jgi:hypothetical protein
MTGDGTAGHPDWPHIGVALMQPRARGCITLVSPDPGVPPRIEHRYDSEPEDVAALRQGSDLARELASAATYVGHRCGRRTARNHCDARAPRGGIRSLNGLWPRAGKRLGRVRPAVVDQSAVTAGCSSGEPAGPAVAGEYGGVAGE